MMQNKLLLFVSVGLTLTAWLSVRFNPTSMIADLFVCTDLLVAMTLAALPLSFSLHLNVREGGRRWILTVCWLMLLVIVASMAPGVSSSMNNLDSMRQFECQLAIACCLAFPLGLGLLEVMKPGDRSEPETANGTSFTFSMIAACLVLVTASFSYRQFLILHYEGNVEDFLRDQRIVKASDAMQIIAHLNPTGQTINERNTTIANQLQAQVELEYEKLLQRERPNTKAEVGALIQALLRLDELELAERQLRPLLELRNPSPVVWDTLGVIRQRQSRWTESKAAYRKAAKGWDQHQDSAQYWAGLASAYRGIAFAEWQSGHNRNAAEAYEQLIANSPTAENHLIAAQFYEQAQQTNRSFKHARQVLATGSNDQVASANEIIQKLETAHFGCFQVYSQRGSH